MPQTHDDRPEQAGWLQVLRYLAAALFGVWPSNKDESARILGEDAEDGPSSRTDKEPRGVAHD